MQHEFFRAPWQANGSPSLSILKLFVCPNLCQYQIDVYKGAYNKIFDKDFTYQTDRQNDMNQKIRKSLTDDSLKAQMQSY